MPSCSHRREKNTQQQPTSEDLYTLLPPPSPDSSAPHSDLPLVGSSLTFCVTLAFHVFVHPDPLWNASSCVSLKQFLASLPSRIDYCLLLQERTPRTCHAYCNHLHGILLGKAYLSLNESATRINFLERFMSPMCSQGPMLNIYLLNRSSG